MVKVSRRLKEITYNVIMFAMLCQCTVINPVQKSEEFVMCQTFSMVSFDGNECPNCINCKQKWMKQFKEMQGSQFVVSLQRGFSIGIMNRIPGSVSKTIP
jgi:hypothetical protein